MLFRILKCCFVFFILVDNYFRSLYRYDLPVSGKFCTILVTACRWWFAKLTDLFLQFWISWPRSTGFTETQFRLFWKESVKNSRRKGVSETRSGSGVPNIWFCGAPRVSRVARGIHLNDDLVHSSIISEVHLLNYYKLQNSSISGSKPITASVAILVFSYYFGSWIK